MPRESMEERIARMNAMYSAGAAAQLAVETTYRFTKETVKDSVGCVLEGVPTNLGNEKGWCVRVKAVRSGGHAERVGMAVGMAVLTINGMAIKTPSQGVNILNNAEGEVTITAAPPTDGDHELFVQKQNPEVTRKEKLLAEQHRQNEKQRLEREMQEAQRMAERATQLAHELELRKQQQQLEEEATAPVDVADAMGPQNAEDITAEINAQMEAQDDDVAVCPPTKSSRPVEAPPMWAVLERAVEETPESPSTTRHMWRGEPHVRIVLGDGTEMFVRVASLVEIAPDVAAALPPPVDSASAAATEGGDEAETEQTGSTQTAPRWDSRDLTFPGIDARIVQSVVGWIEAAYDVRAAESALDAATEAVMAARKPLVELTASELAHLFQYHAFQKGALLLTCAADVDVKADGGDGVSAAGEGDADADAPRILDGPAAPIESKPQPVFRAGEAVEISGAMLNEDAADGFDETSFCERYGAYRTETLLRHVPMWQSRGVPLQEMIPRAERERADVDSERLQAATLEARAHAAAVASRCVADEGLCLGTLLLGDNLGLSELVGTAVDTLAEHFHVDGAAEELIRARATGVNRYIDRLSGFCVANIYRVTATPRWNELVPVRERTRMLALAATARSNPLGLSKGAVGAASLAEVVAYAKETLREMQERLETAKVDTKADEATGAASAEHAWHMIADQEQRMRVLRAFIASQEAMLSGSR